MRRLAPTLLAATATAAALVLSACGGSSSTTDTTDAQTSAASSEGLVLYSGRNEALVGPLVTQFTADTGIPVEVRYGSTGEISALLLEEGDQSPADVFLSQDAGALGALTTAGLSSTLPAELTDKVPAGFTSDDDSWVGVTGRARVIVYDSEQLTDAEVPASVDALTAPQWKGQVAFAPGNASFQSFVTAQRVLDGEDAAQAWVEGIAANEPVLTESNGDSLELVNLGTAKIGLINHYYWYEMAAEAGADAMRAQLKFLPGDAGGIVNVTGATILKSAEGDTNAEAFIDYLLSDKGQQYFVDETFEYPLVSGVAAPEGLPALDSLVNPGLDLSDLESLSQTQELLARYGLI